MEEPAKRISLSVFFPCFNEEANLERTTLAAIETCKEISNDFEIIIVNDGSRDRTKEIAEGLEKKFPFIRSVHHGTNQGYGSALQSGFRAAQKDWVFYTDGDGQFDFSELEGLIPKLCDYDIISAYRLNRCESIARKLNGFAWTQLVNWVFRIKFRDIDCAFKMFPRRLFEQMELEATGALIDTEVLVKAQNLGYRIGQIGVHHYPRTKGHSTGANMGVIVRVFKELFLLRKNILSENPTRRTAQKLTAHRKVVHS